MVKYNHTKLHRFMKQCGRRILSVLLVASLCVAIAVPTSAQEALLKSTGEETLESVLAMDKIAPVGLANAQNPYGYDVDIPFTLSVGHELMYYGGWNGSTERKILNTDSLNSLKTFVDAPNKGTASNTSVPSGTWNWIQAVAFSSSNQTAKKDKILFVGVKASNQNGYAWVLDYNANKVTTPLELGNMDWIGTDYDQYSSTGLFDVAAGDFNGDGIDTLLVYAPLNLNSAYKTGCVLYELSYNGSSLTTKCSANQLLMDQYINDQANVTYTDKSDTDDTCRDKLAVSMQVGDFNGDNRDDLAVLSYSHYRYNKGNTAYYSPQLKICYGASDLNSFNGRNADEVFTTASQSGSTLTFPVAASLAAGDYNGDGCDDLYVVGVKSTATVGNNISSINVFGDTWYLHRFNGTLNHAMTNAGYTTIDSNEWFEDGFYADDYCYGKTLAVGAALSGNAAPAALFIAGSIYDVSSGTPIHKLTGSYFTSSDQGLGSVTATNTFMQSVQVGNFDNNSAGREQIAFVVGMKQSGADDYWFKAGIACGTDFADTTYADGSTCYGAAKGYYCTDIDESEYIHENKGDDPDEGLNCFFVALDCDDDSLQAKYRGVNYIYTDPVVNVVLQAAPYFGDISTSGLNTTGYMLQTEYVTSTSNINNMAASIGFAASGSVPFAETTSASAGIQGGFSASHTSSDITTYTETFEAGGYDVVVVSRTPMLIYQYDVLTNGAWTGETQMEFAIPEGPVYQLMQVEQYNQFTEAYNAMMEQAGADNYQALQPIDTAANWLNGNEGNPYAYNQSGWANDEIEATQVNKGNGYALGTTGGRTIVSLSEGTADEDSFTAEVGFYVNVSVLFGPKAIANYGIELSGEYTHGWGTATTTTNTSGSSFAVQDLDGDALLARGMEEEILARYGFTWTCGTWKRHLGMVDADGKPVKTLFLGYSLRDISSPPAAVTDLKVETVQDGSVTLSWTKPSTTIGWPSVDGYTVYQQTKNNDGTLGYKALYTIDNADITSVTLTELADGSALQPDTEYTFVVCSMHASTNGAVYGAKSNTVTVRMPERIITESLVTFSDMVRNEEDAVIGTVSATVQDMPISNGAIVSDPVAFTATPEEGYVLTSWIVTVDGQTHTYPTNDQNVFTVELIGEVIDVTATFAPLSTVFETIRIEQPSEGGTIHLYNADGAELVPDEAGNYTVNYNTPITFTAIPQTGYVLNSWTDDAAQQTDLSFTVVVTRNMTVGAIFKAPVKYAVYYTATDDMGNTIAATPAVKSGSAVAAGTEVTFEANATDGFYIKKWTITKGDVVTEYTMDDNTCTQDTRTLIVDASTTVEVTFVMPTPILGQKPPISRPSETPDNANTTTMPQPSPKTGDVTSVPFAFLTAILSAGIAFAMKRSPGLRFLK